MRKLTKRQKAYRKFLSTKLWKSISERKRDLIGKCEECGSGNRLECHHVEYPEKWEDTTDAQLRVLCRECHRRAHGLYVMSEFDRLLKAVHKRLNYCKPDNWGFPTDEEIRTLISLVEYEDEQREVEALFREMAGLRIILTSSKMWDSWLKKPREIKGRLWIWASEKFDRMQQEVLGVG